MNTDAAKKAISNLGYSPATEPALKVGASTASVAGVIALINMLFPEFLNERQTTLVLVISAIVLPIVTAVLTRPRVWSPASVREVINEVVSEATEAATSKEEYSKLVSARETAAREIHRKDLNDPKKH